MRPSWPGVLAWLLVALLPLQVLTALYQEGLGPAHVHVEQDAHSHGDGLIHTHAHAQTERHHHAPDDDSVVVVHDPGATELVALQEEVRPLMALVAAAVSTHVPKLSDAAAARPQRFMQARIPSLPEHPPRTELS
jgi:hypothetical protein